MSNYDKLKEELTILSCNLAELDNPIGDKFIIVNEAISAISDLQYYLTIIEEYVDGLVRVHLQFASAAQGSWSGKKQRVRAAEASQILAFIRKQKIKPEG